MKITAIAPSNIAFIKYWGKKDEVLRLPSNGSISVNLNNLFTTTTVEFSPKYKKDFIEINGLSENNENQRVVKHLDRIRKMAGISNRAKVVSKNNFPTPSGLASSASGFAALSLAGAKAAGLSLSEKELSILARQGSGSACRSIPDGFVEWLDGETSDTSYAVSLYPPEFWDLSIIIAVVKSRQKEIKSTEGQERAIENPFFQVRITRMKGKILQIKKYLSQKNFLNFGQILEKEALELHAIAFTSDPPIIYWEPGTINIIKMVQALRKGGIPVFFTIDAGPNVHIVCEEKNTKIVAKNLQKIPEASKIIINKPSSGARLIDRHLF